MGVDKQRRVLVAALQRDGLLFEAESMKVLQYNPPYTLPWLRLNAVTFSLSEFFPEPTEDAFDCSAGDMPSDVNSVLVEAEAEIISTSTSDGSESVQGDPDTSSETIYYSSPEAGE